jgi:hypothetical protein
VTYRVFLNSVVGEANRPASADLERSTNVCNVMLVPSRTRTTLLWVRRRCLVCEHEDEVEEAYDSAPIGAPCLQCHAPTERIEVLGRRSAAVDRNVHAAALGRLGGLKGGPARAATLSATRRREIARAAARARWSKQRGRGD